MSIVENSRFPRVFDYFEALSRIPRGSGNTKAVSGYCVDFAAAHGLKCRQDGSNNVVIWKPASAGREGEPAVMIQGHLDMVAAKEENAVFDFTRDGLRLMREGDLLGAEGTTLGGDDGIAVAMCLAILEDDSLSHPALECVFTVDEELGMLGAVALDMSDLTAKYLINLDCEDEGVLTVSCAGGSRVRLAFPAPTERTTGVACRVQVTGLRGGHSGVEIHENRVNADHLLARIAKRLTDVCPCLMGGISGGAADNAIPGEAAAIFVAGEEEISRLEAALLQLKEEYEKEICPAEPDFTLTWELSPEDEVSVSPELTRLLPLFDRLPNGVQAMSRALPGLVETSLNLGMMKWDGSELLLTLSVRSSVEESRLELEDRLKSIAEEFGGRASVSGAYPGWPVKPDSRLVSLASAVWKEMTGEEMKVEAIHAGLECGVFISKMPGLDIIATGPNMYNIHSTRERLSISSTEKVYAWVTELLARI